MLTRNAGLDSLRALFCPLLYKEIEGSIDMPKLEIKQLLSPQTKSAIDLHQKDSTKRMREEFQLMMKEVRRKDHTQPKDYQRLSVKPLKEFDQFPQEWLDNMKALKGRVNQLKMDIHSINRPTNN